jgi:hypothetical protein
MRLGLGLGLTRPLGSGGGVAKRMSVVATRAQQPRELLGAAGEIMTRSGHFLTDNVDSIQLVFANWRGDEQPASASTATLYASVEYPVGSASKPVTFGGQAFWSAPSGGYIISDPISIPGATAGQPIAIRNWYSSAGGFPYHTNSLPGINGIDACNYANGVGSVANQTNDNSTVVNKSDGVQLRPLAIIGLTNKRVVGVTGDSCGFGVGESATDSFGTMGEICRSLNDVVHINWSVPGGSAGAMFNGNAFAANFQQRALFMQNWCTDSVFQYGRNDMNAGTTAAQLDALYAKFVSLLPGISCTPVTVGMSFTSSTDSWATLANQTVAAFEAQRLAYNTLVRARARYIDIARAYRAADDGKWPVDGTAFKYTADGTHATQAGYALILAASPNPFLAFRASIGAP